MNALTAQECEAMRDIAAERPVDVETEAVTSLADRKLISITLGGRILILEAGEKWYDANCETN